MFIQTEATPNPLTLKFLPGQAVLESGAMEFSSADDAAHSPLASRIFALDGVRRIFLSREFLAVTLHEGIEWPHIKPAILGAIMDHYVSGDPVVVDAPTAQATHARPMRDHSDETRQIIAEIEDLLENKVRPAVARDGGDITFEDFDAETGVLTLKMRGACAGCPSSSMTLKQGVETMMRHYVPEVTQVVAAA